MITALSTHAANDSDPFQSLLCASADVSTLAIARGRHREEEEEQNHTTTTSREGLPASTLAPSGTIPPVCVCVSVCVCVCVCASLCAYVRGCMRALSNKTQAHGCTLIQRSLFLANLELTACNGDAFEHNERAARSRSRSRSRRKKKEKEKEEDACVSMTPSQPPGWGAIAALLFILERMPCTWMDALEGERKSVREGKVGSERDGGRGQGRG